MKLLMNATLIAVVCLISCEAPAQLTNRVLISSKLQLELLAELPPVSRTAITGDIQSATSTILSTNRFSAAHRIICAFTVPETQAANFALYPRERPFLFDLQDDLGNLVPKAQTGAEMTGPTIVSTNIRNTTLRFDFASPSHGFYRELFTPQDCFALTNKGLYTLNLRVRVWTELTNGNYGFVLSPPLRVIIDKAQTSPDAK
jgi:hypothetical protein